MFFVHRRRLWRKISVDTLPRRAGCKRDSGGIGSTKVCWRSQRMAASRSRCWPSRRLWILIPAWHRMPFDTQERLETRGLVARVFMGSIATSSCGVKPFVDASSIGATSSTDSPVVAGSKCSC